MSRAAATIQKPGHSHSEVAFPEKKKPSGKRALNPNIHNAGVRVSDD